MNGRIYDPTLGRFLQADPFIQAPMNSQNYNRYSYVLNNPLSYTDPSGYFFKKLKKFVKRYWRVAVAAVATYVTAGAASGWAASWAASMGMTTTVSLGSFGSFTMLSTTGSIFAGAASGAIAGAVGGAILTGSLEGALRGAFSGATFGGINRYFGDTWNWNRVGANTIAEGVNSKASGGNFADGAKLSFALSVTKLGFEKMKAYTNKLKYRAIASNPKEQNEVYLENGELDTTGTRGPHPDSPPGKESILGRKFGMEPEGKELSLPGPFGSYNIKPYKYFINDVSKVHDFFNPWHYYQVTGHWAPMSTQLGAELFEIYSFVGMPVAAAYTGASYLAPYPISGFRELHDD